MLYLSHREKETRVLGPGVRYAIWVQGCKKHCPGCIFPAGRNIATGGEYVTTEKIFDEIKEMAGITGVTISGGEPFLQADPLRKLVELIRTQTKLDIMMYSGYRLEELQDMHDKDIDFLLAHIDILVDGEYIESQNTNRLWRGSDNQNIHFLSEKYLPFRDKILEAKTRNLEFVYRTEGELFMVGLPPKDFEKRLWDKLEKRMEDNL